MSKIDLNKFKDVVSQLKTKQEQLKHLVSRDTLKEAKKYAEASGAELKKLLKTDAEKVRKFIEKESKEIHKLQAKIPQELAKFSKLFEGQKKEFEKIVNRVAGTPVGKKLNIKKVKKPRVAKKAAAKVEEVISQVATENTVNEGQTPAQE